MDEGEESDSGNEENEWETCKLAVEWWNKGKPHLVRTGEEKNEPARIEGGENEGPLSWLLCDSLYVFVFFFCVDWV